MGIIDDFRVKMYLNGGAVRDNILGVEPKDKDYTAVSNMTFKGLTRVICFEGKIYHAWPDYLAIRAKLKGQVTTITMARSEKDYTDGRHPDEVDQVYSLKEDSKRRDFTINAMYMDDTGKIYDFHDGKKHIKEKKIVCVGKASERFKEDYLRILRAVRLSCQLGFDIDRSAMMSMVRLASNIDDLNAEVIKSELDKAFYYDSSKAFKLLDKLKLWDILRDKGLSLAFKKTEV
jgi:tRNA nucleotidyltransferase (CCA-adding enzyme)